MRKNIFRFLLILFVSSSMITSCLKPGSSEVSTQQSEGKYINQLFISGDNLWVRSSYPVLEDNTTYQVSVTNLKTSQFVMNENIPAVSRLALDNNQIPFLTTFDSRILKLNPDLSYAAYLAIPVKYSIRDIRFDGENNLWIATNSGGLYSYNGIDTINFNSSNSILNSDFIESMTKDSESNIWFTQGNELFRISDKGELSKDPNMLPDDNLSGALFLSADKDNTLWVIRWDGSDNRIFKKSINGSWTEVSPPESSAGLPVKFIRSDSRGTIWIAYSENPRDLLAYFNNDTWVEIQIPLNEVVVTDLDIYNDGLIIGTPEGIYASGIYTMISI
jgi:ligand-binding sensor domain-containing protein